MPKTAPAALLAVLLLLVVPALSGCDRGDAADGRPRVLATFTVLADIGQNVAGDRLTVESLTKPGAEIHGYEPTPADVRRAAKADLIIENGMNLEAWFGRFVADLDVPHVVASDGVEPIDIAAEAYAGKPNPHAWMSPRSAEIYVDNLVRAFSDLDPDGAAEFAANGEAYKEQLRAVRGELTDALGDLPAHQRALVTCEGAFSYLARDTGLTESYIWPVNAEAQATPAQMAGTIDFVRKNDVPAVFCESTVSDAPMRQIVSATDARFGGTLYVDSLSAAGGPVPTYLDLLRHDTELIVDGLTGDRR
ncbi:manganese ABC transporter substrate-binding protein [Gordonia hirsuta DSM 44140 = NBRC 16056]|uniref:Manganese ABC transporter substrate-binding protein n=1 Tax=Gordonia hirsuta DSM 44140 = NBRC 16056 TaxID=1121927 RepID=L7LC59_9ACTN|nr:manganese ABC transporter substrate-binding protein [Gordonia hirsuta DSM 44140 = NBRC 16056]